MYVVITVLTMPVLRSILLKYDFVLSYIQLLSDVKVIFSKVHMFFFTKHYFPIQDGKRNWHLVCVQRKMCNQISLHGE